MKNFLSTLIKAFFTFGIVMLTTSVIAAESSAILSAATNKFSCRKFAHIHQPFILILNRGDNLLESITQCAKDAKLIGASMSGLGQLHNPTLAYFTGDPDAKATLTTFSGYYELASLNGNITNNANKYHTHAHAVLGDNQFHSIAGHLITATVGQTAEITIVPFLAPVQRAADPKKEFGPITP